MNYLAHIRKDNLLEESVAEHAQKVADTAAGFAADFNGESWGYCCGIMHDIGKYSAEFLKRLHGGPAVDHSTAGAIELMKLKGYYPLAAYCVAGHHAGLPDFGTDADQAWDSTTLSARKKKKIPYYMDYQKELSVPQLTRPEIIPLAKGGFSVSFFIRMVYSCLVDADFLETEKFMSDRNRERKPGCISEELLCRFMRYISPWLNNVQPESVNGQRTKILLRCLEAGKEKLEKGAAGIYQLTVPTGGGKTTASLAFALQHACCNNKKRIIYVIPYTSIIEQNAEIFRKILGEEHVLENHSHVQYDNQEEFSPMQLAAENWDKPVIVTTNVQFFESLFSNKSSRCRKLHNIANSVIIFDEAQMLPIDYLKPCVRAMSELAINYRSTIVLCTATQPSLHSLFAEIHPSKIVHIQELCPNVQEQFGFFRRTEIKNQGTLSEEVLLQKLRAEKSALCIFNNRKRVQKIYQKIKGTGVYHLSTLMYPEHRKKKLEEIRAELLSGRKCIVIATNLVEAGVDLDFCHVYRELAGIDSVIQAAGRCNREGRHTLSESNTYVFQLEEKMPVPVELKASIAIGRFIAEKYEDISSLEAIQDYFQQLHYVKKEQLDKKAIIERFENGVRNHHYDFASIAKDVCLIEEKTRIVLIGKEDKAKMLISRLRYGERSRTLIQEVGRYSVQVYENDWEKLRAAGYLEELDTEISLLRNLENYSEDMGLLMNVDWGEAVFLD